MSQLHPGDDDAIDDRTNTEDGLRLRVKWVKQLRAALGPFVEGRATEADRQNALAVLENTKEWL